MNNACIEQPIMYAVYANHIDRKVLLGIASGDPEDIKAFYDNQKAYGLDLYLERLQPNPIPPGYAALKDTLLAKRRLIAAQLADLDEQLKKLGGWHGTREHDNDNV